MRFCDNVNCEFGDEPLERISDYRVRDGVVLCVGCVEDEEYEQQMNASNRPDSGYQEYDPEVGQL
mgnify:CR=1 FL=1